MALYHNMTEMIGGTPLLALERLGQERGWQAKVLAKLEYFNPAGSVKDRAALGMIRAAEKEGRLRPGSVIVEPTSGNTGIGLAAIAAVRGYRVILTMPETMSLERRKLLAAYGAEIVLTPGDQGMQGSIDRAKELLREIPGSIIAGQFDNSANPAAHYASTGPEIWRDTEGQVDIFVAGVGSAGTITGVGRYLKEQSPAVQIVAAEPADSPVLSGGKAAARLAAATARVARGLAPWASWGWVRVAFIRRTMYCRTSSLMWMLSTISRRWASWSRVRTCRTGSMAWLYWRRRSSSSSSAGAG